MEAIVLQALCNVNSFDSRALLELSSIKDKFVCTTASLVSIKNRIMGREARKDIVGVEQRDLGCMSKATAP